MTFPHNKNITNKSVGAVDQSVSFSIPCYLTFRWIHLDCAWISRLWPFSSSLVQDAKSPLTEKDVKTQWHHLSNDGMVSISHWKGPMRGTCCANNISSGEQDWQAVWRLVATGDAEGTRIDVWECDARQRGAMLRAARRWVGKPRQCRDAAPCHERQYRAGLCGDIWSAVYRCASRQAGFIRPISPCCWRIRTEKIYTQREGRMRR